MLILIILGAAVAFLCLYWFSRKNEGFGEGIAHLCVLVASPCNAVHDELMQVSRSVREYLPRPKKVNHEEPEEVRKDKKGRVIHEVDTLHHKAHNVISDLLTAFVGFIIIAADTYMAYVFNSSLFNTHEVSLSGGLFEWCASLLWIATPAMYGIAAFQAAGIEKSSGLFPRLGVGWRILVGLISFLLMCLSIFLVMYAYAFRGVKIFDPTNTYQIAQMGESTLDLLGLLVAAASIFALVAIKNGLSTLLTILLFALLVFSWVAATLLHLVALVLDRIAVSCTDGRIRVLEQETPAPEVRTLPAAVDQQRRELREQYKDMVIAPPAHKEASQQDSSSQENGAYSWFPVEVEPLTSVQSNGHTEEGDESKKKLKV